MLFLEEKNQMKDKIELTVVQNFSSEEFTNLIVKLIKNEINLNLKYSRINKPEAYLTRKETAKILQISLTCLNDWSNKGILIPYKLGNRTYFKLSDIEMKLNISNSKNTQNEN